MQMKNLIRKRVLCLLILLVIFSSNNFAQKHLYFDKMPIDTTKWTITDTLHIDFNCDGINDVMLVFDKYNKLTRPDNIQTPVLFYLGSKSHKYYFNCMADKIIYSPYYEIKEMDNKIIITQKGVRQDNCIYSNYYELREGNIFMVKEVVTRKSNHLLVNEATGDVKIIDVRFDTLRNQPTEIRADQYNIIRLVHDFSAK